MVANRNNAAPAAMTVRTQRHAGIDKRSEPETAPKPATPMPKEIGGPKGPEPTRYGDWEVRGRCTDF
jgi:hypothetical protein